MKSLKKHLKILVKKYFSDMFNHTSWLASLLPSKELLILNNSPACHIGAAVFVKPKYLKNTLRQILRVCLSVRICEGDGDTEGTFNPHRAVRKTVFINLPE